MKIRAHSESHIVELDDGTKWRVFPGDLDVTLNWQPDAELKLVLIADEVSSHALISENDNSRVRVIPASENWPVQEVRTIISVSTDCYQANRQVRIATGRIQLAFDRCGRSVCTAAFNARTPVAKA
jgi:hypothetical protein